MKICNILHHLIKKPPSQVFLAVAPPSSSGNTNKKRFILAAAARGGASFRSADAAQVCNTVGFVSVDGVIECSEAKAARQIVSEGW